MNIDFKSVIAKTKLEIRPYQLRIITKAIKAYIDQGVRSILIDSPVGSGKTAMMLVIAKIMHDHFGMRIGWVAMRRNLLEQAYQESIKQEIVVPIKFISMFDKYPPLDIDMLIVDEAQHDVTGSMMHIHTVIQPKHILGASGTPFRVDRVKLCFDKVLKDAGIAALIKDNYLANYEHYTIKDWAPATIIDTYLKSPDIWGKSLIYFLRIDTCKQVMVALRRGGVPCDVVTASSDVEKQIELFREGKLQVLLNCAKLTEGFNEPTIKTVFCRPSCKSVTIQMCGRVLRIHSNYKHKQIVQSEKTRWPFARTALPILQHVLVNDEWRTLEVNTQIEDVGAKALRAIATNQTVMPEFITKAQMKKPGWNWRNTTRRLSAGAAVSLDSARPEERTNYPDTDAVIDTEAFRQS